MTAPPTRPPHSLEGPGHTNASLALTVPPELVEHLAVRVADVLAERAPTASDGYLGVEEAAAYLACPKSRMYELVAAKRVRHYRDGRRVLFKAEDLDAVLRVREAEA